MIKFFRRIRQKLLTENKFSKYMIYAIGEIILVVIGILIALQINNWNSYTKDRQKEKIYLNNIKRDLNNQLFLLEDRQTGETSTLDALQNVNNSFVENKGFVITLKNIANISTINDRYTFSVVKTTFNEIQSTGNFDIIKDLKLKDTILNYYDEMALYEKIIHNNNFQKDNGNYPESLNLTAIAGDVPFSLNLSDGLLGTFDNLDEKTKELVSLSLTNPENQLKLINLIRFRKLIAEYHRDIYSSLIKKTKELIAQIPETL
jgi:hypothetical protein